MKTTVSIVLMSLALQVTLAQGKYLTNDGVISFYSHTVIEDITATNENVAAVIDSETGEVAIIVVMNEFQFEKKLMQEHFNENYVESEKYPKAIFNGKISNNGEVKYQTPGEYQVRVAGEMTIHGVTRKVSAEGTIEVTENNIAARSKFMLNPEEYEIKIPKVVRNNIAEKMEISAELVCRPL
jgi:polyisoprenoid-binding protein YceI